MSSFDNLPPNEHFESKFDVDNTEWRNSHRGAVIPPSELERIRYTPRSPRSLVNNGIMSPSMNSFTTYQSTNTQRVSNTTRRHCEKKKKKIFFNFIKILMKIVERNDKNKFETAKGIIHKYEQQKRSGKIESLMESLRCSSLKVVVGPQYWKEALEQLSRAILKSESKREGPTNEGPTCPPVTPQQPMLCRDDDFSIPSPCPFAPSLQSEYDTNRNDANTTEKTKEARTRRKRRWMIICALMKHLKNTDLQLYHKAHALVKKECRFHHRRCQQFEEHHSLSKSLQFCLKNEIGVAHWRRAENYVAKALLERQEDLEQVDDSSHLDVGGNDLGCRNDLGGFAVFRSQHKAFVLPKKRFVAPTDDLATIDVAKRQRKDTNFS